MKKKGKFVVSLLFVMSFVLQAHCVLAANDLKKLSTGQKPLPVVVCLPNGGQVFTAGSVMTVEWATTKSLARGSWIRKGNIWITLETGNQTVYRVVASPGETRSQFVIPSYMPAGEYVIRITYFKTNKRGRVVGRVYTDISDSTFSVIPAPTSPPPVVPPPPVVLNFQATSVSVVVAGQSTQYTAMVNPPGSYSYRVDWGDGSSEETFLTNVFVHTYCTGGVYTITLTVIYGNSLTVIFRSAVTVVAPVPATSVDLAVVLMSINPDRPLYSGSDDVVVTVVVKNIGDKISGVFNTSFENITTGYVLGTDVGLSPLVPGETRTFQFSYAELYWSQNGVNSLVFTVDTTNSVQESNEVNNIFTKVIQVQNATSRCIKDIDF